MNTKHPAFGFALVSVMIFAALGGVLATALLYGVGSQIISAAREIRSEKAFFIAEAGVELAKAELRSDGASNFFATTNFSGGEARYRTTITTPSNVIIWSTGTYENVSRKLEVAVCLGTGNYPPPSADGALGVYGTGTVITVSGNASIDGQDYNVPANFDCNGASCSGTVTTNPAAPGVFSSITGTVVTTSGSGDISGNPPTTNGTSQFSTNYWQDQADEWISQATITFTGGTYAATTDLGTRDNPQITHVTGDLEITSNIDGAGILIVMDGIDLTLKGNIHYEGIILLLGNNHLTIGGTIRIFGAMILASGGSSYACAQGTPSVLYSSQALANLKNLQLNPRPLSVVYWKEIK